MHHALSHICVSISTILCIYLSVFLILSWVRICWSISNRSNSTSRDQDRKKRVHVLLLLRRRAFLRFISAFFSIIWSSVSIFWLSLVVISNIFLHIDGRSKAPGDFYYIALQNTIYIRHDINVFQHNGCVHIFSFCFDASHFDDNNEQTMNTSSHPCDVNNKYNKILIQNFSCFFSLSSKIAWKLANFLRNFASFVNCVTDKIAQIKKKTFCRRKKKQKKVYCLSFSIDLMFEKEKWLIKFQSIWTKVMCQQNIDLHPHLRCCCFLFLS